VKNATGTVPRIAVLASGRGSNLKAIAEACANGEIPARIVAVGSNRPGAGALAQAEAMGIPTLLVNHRDYGSREAFDAALLDALTPHAPDLVVLAGFMRILTAGFTRAFSGRLLNIHPSLLPKYPGLHTHARAIEAGDREAGATVHFVTEALDGGPPILQAAVPIESGDTPESLAARVLAVEHHIYPLAIAWWASGRLRLAQDAARLDGVVLPATGLRIVEGKIEGMANGSGDGLA
jgi:phosphoribosylglycinamide formyltransferase-1